MAFNLTDLHASLKAVAPVVGVCISGSWTNKAGWRVDYDPNNPPTAAQIAAVQTAISNFNPSALTPAEQYAQALSAGVNLSWTTSTTLNDTYPIDEMTQTRMLAERLWVSVNSTFTNGTTTLTWYGSTGTAHQMSMAQANAYLKAVWAYITALWVAYNTALSGGTPSWPSASITVNA